MNPPNQMQIATMAKSLSQSGEYWATVCDENNDPCSPFSPFVASPLPDAIASSVSDDWQEEIRSAISILQSQQTNIKLQSDSQANASFAFLNDKFNAVSQKVDFLMQVYHDKQVFDRFAEYESKPKNRDTFIEHFDIENECQTLLDLVREFDCEILVETRSEDEFQLVFYVKFEQAIEIELIMQFHELWHDALSAFPRSKSSLFRLSLDAN